MRLQYPRNFKPVWVSCRLQPDRAAPEHVQVVAAQHRVDHYGVMPNHKRQRQHSSAAPNPSVQPSSAPFLDDELSRRVTLPNDLSGSLNTLGMTKFRRCSTQLPQSLADDMGQLPRVERRPNPKYKKMREKRKTFRRQRPISFEQPLRPG